ncbi:hypothetical protein [Alteromonas sp. a30]|uniref:hypothetical protein n=1 Tax=Alteromonas sp. a30 TaxID=2730917 RepID=UPI00227DA2ED|nr:hypothetical protein [Alteromonas sp. a30]MCY7295103.1 hypothetical protein [Alteromonas sp. a30]
MTIVVDDIRTFIAEAIEKESIYLAWGRGDSEWQTPPSEERTQMALQDPIGFRQVSRTQYVVPDELGEIVLSSGSFSISAEPTNHLYVEFRYDFEDAQGEVIRETMVYIGTEIVEGLPPGQKYFAPEQIEKVGRAALLSNFGPRERTVGTRSTYEYVISL